MNNILFSDLTKIYNLALNPMAPDLLTELNKTKDFVALFDKIFDIAKKRLSVDSEYSEYFKFYESQIRYEIYMKVYDTLYLARKIQNPVKINQRNYATLYADISGLAVDTLTSEINRNLVSIHDDHENRKLFTTPFDLKRNIYFNYIYIPPEAQKIIEYSPIKLDIAFNIYKLVLEYK